MRHVHFTDRGNAANEDFAFSTERYGVVIDGATGLVEMPLVSPDFVTNAQWFSHVAGEALCAALDSGMAPEQALAGAVDKTRAELEAALGHPAGSLDPAAVPSATLALAVVGEKDVELWGLGDSPFVALMRDGELLISTDEVLESLDARVVGLMIERSAGRELSVAERRALVRDEVLANRRLRNTPGGYWCLDATGEGLAHARHLTIPRAEAVAVAGMTDGIFRAFGQYGMAPLVEWMRDATYFSAQRLCDRMRVLEAEDAQLRRYPRMKVGDDASLFWLGF
ncbi:MAG TPA: protein phosphatase 2C domain-containing protein [Candidatus Olsenella excrementavium]|uniref:Protein phosphatase 2C domain-containing protein n=1 Tax=Candidatus Olsenella excrementavium TaxID=2838709 RepID=A0A9D2CFP5_9ACTN|nr:protein phosphatase 2C domain-containing protein [Candidatus Olsenella excrementavium]